MLYNKDDCSHNSVLDEKAHPSLRPQGTYS